MTRFIALALIIAVPAFAQGRRPLLPSYEQPQGPAWVEPLEERPVTWAVAAAGTACVIAAVALLLIALARPAGERAALCAGAPRGCDGQINPPPP